MCVRIAVRTENGGGGEMGEEKSLMSHNKIIFKRYLLNFIAFYPTYSVV